MDGLVIADSKVSKTFNDTLLSQMAAYLNIMDLTLTRLLTFKNVRPDCMRVVR